MTRDEARRLKKGDIVIWDGDEDDRGEVIEVNPNVAVRIQWTTYPECGWLTLQDMQRVSLRKNT